MQLWSKGLGTKTVTLRLGEGKLENSGDKIVMRGKMGPPVWWDYAITMTEEDLIDILQIAGQASTVSFMCASKKRWSIYSAGAKQVLKIVLGSAVGLVRGIGRRSPK